MTKDERQQISVNRFLKADARGTLELTMRFGKTRTAIKIIRRYLDKYTDNVIIVVPSVVIVDVWNNEINDYFKHKYDNHIIVTTVDKVLNAKNTTCGLLIIDEIHKFTSDARLELIKGNKIDYVYILGLTGTYPYNNEVLNKYVPVVDKITESEAIANKWISQYEIYNIPLELSETDKYSYLQYSTSMRYVLDTFRGIHKMILKPDGTTFFNNDLELILACYSGKNVKGVGYIKAHLIRETVAVKMGWQPELDLTNEHHKQIVEYWSPDAIKDNVESFYIAMNKRNEIHNINQVKLEAVLKIYAKFNNNIFMVFNESVDFANMITDAINNTFNTDKAITYHSQIKSKPLVNFITNEYFKQKDGTIKKFGKKKQLDYIIEMLKIRRYNLVSTVKALDEGFNVDNIDIIITTSGTANPMQYAQRNARGLTIDAYNKNKVTKIFNLYFDDFSAEIDGKYRVFNSRDKRKLILRSENNVLKCTNLDDILS
jgi:superfamily II DNA or RNA helicase